MFFPSGVCFFLTILSLRERQIVVEKSYAADDVLQLKRVYNAIAFHLPSPKLNELLGQCREAFQGYDLIKHKGKREHEKSAGGQLQAIDAPLDISKSCKKRGKRTPKHL